MRGSAPAHVACSFVLVSLVACEPPPAPPTGTGPTTSAVATSSKPAPSARPTTTAVVPKPCASSGPQLIEEKEYTGVILPLDYPWSRGAKRWRLDKVGVAEAEYCIARELSKMKATPAYQAAKVPQIVKRLKEYRRQYLGYTDDKGVDMVWVNFFHDPKGTHADWRTQLVTVRGGGHGYFNVVADVAAGTCGELHINSPR